MPESTATIAHPTLTAVLGLPPLGAALDAGTYQGVITRKDGTHVAIVLLADKPDKRLSWSDAKAWAESIGAQLPTRQAAATLYANAKAQFEPKWHWLAEELQADTGDEDDASYAWYCDFNDGSQYNDHKSYEGCARAVLLIPLSA